VGQQQPQGSGADRRYRVAGRHAGLVQRVQRAREGLNQGRGRVVEIIRQFQHVPRYDPLGHHDTLRVGAVEE
jgi:hypothetical protein